MSTQTNPYENDDGLHPSDIQISHRTLRVLTICFIVGLLVPAGIRIFSGLKVQELGQKTSHRLQMNLLREGNRKVHIGKNGWLYYSPGLDSLTGYGPLKSEPDSVINNPDMAEWREPLPVIIHFAEQLRKREIDLMLVPVPDKATIQPEGIIPGHTKIQVHPEREKVFAKLKSAGIEIVDLLPLFEKERKSGHDVFLKQDTHWKPEMMQLATHQIAEILRKKELHQPVERKFIEQIFFRNHVGDLVGMLDLGSPYPFGREKVRLKRFSPPWKGDSPVVILGDSFVNIYDDPDLGFGRKGEARIAAGFTAHLSDELGYPVQSFAINGDGATATRQAFASQTDTVVRSKKQVVWVVAERDLFLSRSAAITAGVDWRDVKFNKKKEPLPKGKIIIEAILREKSLIHDPKQVPYTSALYSARFDSIKVLHGDFSVSQSRVLFLWAFREDKLLPSAHIKEGKVYHLTLLPLLQSKVASVTQMNDFFDGEPPLFAEKIEEAP